MNALPILALTGSFFETSNNDAVEISPTTKYKRAAFEVVANRERAMLRTKGEIVSRDLIEAIRTHYPKLAAKDIIWDFSDASVASISRHDFEKIAEAVKTNSHGRRESKTAFVGSSSEMYALSCIYVGITGLAEVPIEYSVFHTLEEAERWIGEDLAVSA